MYRWAFSELNASSHLRIEPCMFNRVTVPEMNGSFLHQITQVAVPLIEQEHLNLAVM